MSALDEAQHLHRQGRLDEARAAYEAILAADASAADVCHRLAILLHQLGDLGTARQHAGRAAEIDPGQAHYHYLAGYLSAESGEHEEACAHFQAAAAARPEWPAAWRSLGEAWLQRGSPEEAQAALRRALALRPNDVGDLLALAAALQESGRPAEAGELCVQVARAQPADPQAQAQLARLAELRGDRAEAIDRLEACLKADPAHAQALLLRSTVLRRQRDPLARLAHERAAAALPDSAAAQAALGDFLWESGEIDAARASFRRATTLDPGSFRAALGASLLLPPIYRSLDELEEKRRAYEAGLSELEARAGQFCRRRAGGLADASWTNFYLAYQGRNDCVLQSRFGDLLSRVVSARAPAYAQVLPAYPARGRIRVGFFSHFFFNCTAGRYFASWVRDLDPARHEKVVFYTNSVGSADTEAIAQAAERFHRVSGLSLERVAALVAGEQLDVLIYPELGMHADTFAMAALRLAPLQLAGWGHPSTSGLPTIDGYLSCAQMEGPDAQVHYREPLFLLPGLGTRYQRPVTTSMKSRQELGLPEGATIYLCPQSLFKIHPDNDRLFAQILAADPRGHLVFFKGRNDTVTQRFEARLKAAMGPAGQAHAARVSFLDYMPHADYLRVNALSDVMLDTLHWSGGNTSLDAIAMGLPIVTRPGTLMRGNQSAAMLRQSGLEQLVVPDNDAYIREAVRLGTDRHWREHCRERLTAGSDTLYDDPRPIAALAALLERLCSAGRPSGVSP